MSSSSNTVIIAGSGRSGTTWVLDVLATANNYKTVFEPLQPDVSAVSKKYAGKYIKPDTKPSDMLSFMDSVVSGSISTVWTDYRAIIDRLKPSLRTFVSLRALNELRHRYKALWHNYRAFNRKNYNGVAVKFIRANLMLGWLCSQYDTKTLFIIRHPGAIIESKIRLDAAAVSAGLQHGTSDWSPHALLDQYLSDKALCDDYLNRYIADLKIDTMSDLEIHVLNWCIENAPVLEIAERYNICISCYEDLLANGDTEWKRISDHLNLPSDLSALNTSQPSQQASADFKKLDTVEEKLSRWMVRFNDAEKESIEKILKLFNVNIYSAFECMPVREVTDRINGRMSS